MAFPSRTGRAASGPMLPKPSTAEPSEMIATEFFLNVKVLALFLLRAIALETAATPGV